jgi:hypothetical protein
MNGVSLIAGYPDQLVNIFFRGFNDLAPTIKTVRTYVVAQM